MPKPIQQPFPALMNAGGSGKGRQFAAKYCDMAFVHIDLPDLRRRRAQVDAYRKLAREEYGRELQIWGNCYVVQRRHREGGRGGVQSLRRRKGRREAAIDLLRM